MGIFQSVFRGFSPSEKIALALVGALVLFAAVQPVFVYAISGDLIFEEHFEQSNSGLANGWTTFSGSSAPTRVTSDSGDGFTVGAFGKGLLIEGASSSDPDEGAERHIATKGYATLRVQYSRAFDNNSVEDDTFVAQYSLDNGATFINLENPIVIGTASHALSDEVVIANPDRHTKIILRFYVNGTASDDNAAIDDVVVYGEDDPFFYDGFESGIFTTGGWTTEDGDDGSGTSLPDVAHDDGDDNKMWTDDNDTATGHSSGSHLSRGHGAHLEGFINNSSNINPDEAIMKSFDATGYQDIKVRYARRITDFESGDNFQARYSTDGGDSWTNLESLGSDEAYASVLFGPIAGANNNPNFKLRFETNTNASGDEVYLDDVVIWGDPAPTGSITIVKVANPEGEQEFDFVPSFDDEFVLTDDGESDDYFMTFENVSTGEHTVTETIPNENWSLTSIFCDDGDSSGDIGSHTATINIAEGEHVTCTFTNTKLGILIVRKETVPDGDDDADFAFTGGWEGTVDGNDETSASVLPGSYAVTESEEIGWDLTGLSCDDENSAGSLETRTATYNIEAGETVRCTFTNTKRGVITVTKLLADSEFESTGPFTFTLSGGQLSEALIAIFNSTFPNLTNSWMFENLLPNNTYTLSEEVPEDWQGDQQISCSDNSDPSSIELNPGENVECIFNNTEFGVISGRKFEDMNGNGNDNEGGDPSREGWVITLSQYDDEGEGGYWEEMDSAETDSETGSFMFSELAPGEYRVCETVQGGWHQTMPNDSTICYEGESGTTYGYTVEISAGQIADGNDFGNFKDAAVSGYKYGDVNGNGTRDFNDTNENEVKDGEEEYTESGLGEWQITATRGNDIRNTTTDTNGHYFFAFGSDDTGEWVISEDFGSDWIQREPVEPNTYTVAISSGTEEDGKDFGNQRKGSISGYKFNDLNGDGEWHEPNGSSNEPGIDGWTIFLDIDDDGVFDEDEPSRETDENGLYSFENLIPGTYIVREVLQSGWMQTYPGTGTTTVVVTSGEEESGWNFGNFELVDITGFKWDDTNGDGVWQKSCDGEGCVAEPGLPDVIMALGRQNGEPKQEDGHEIIPIEIIAMDLTGANGDFAISNVGFGRYKLFEEKKSGWSATNPTARTDSFFDITYDLKAIAIGDPDFDLLRVTGDPDFDLLRDSFFDVFIELSGQNISQSEATQDGLATTVLSMPLEFGNHKLLVLSQEAATETKETSTVIAWTTDFPGTSRVVYDTVSHPVLGSAPNYGYANSTAVFDESPKVTNHSVSISGLSPGTTYYYRTISAASPESVGSEGSFGTPASSSGGGGSGGGGGGGGIVLLPGTSQPETNQQQSGSESAGSVFAAITNSGGVLSGLPIVPSANEQSAPASEESETTAENSENLPAETVETVVTAETALAPASSSAGQESFLAATIATLSFGTQSVWFALATALVILALLTYGGYWLNQKKFLRRR